MNEVLQSIANGECYPRLCQSIWVYNFATAYLQLAVDVESIMMLQYKCCKNFDVDNFG